MKRRDFLISSMVTTPMVVNLTIPTIPFNSNKLKIEVFSTKWGFDDSVTELCKKCKQEGFDGVELWWNNDEEYKEELFAALKEYDLKVAYFAGHWGNEPDEHLKQFKLQIDQILSSPIKAEYINCHSGKDFFTKSVNEKFIEYTINRERASGVEIFHETHRSRICFAANLTREYLEKYIDMKLNLDISHWCCVHESMLGNQQGNLDMAFDRVGLIHARVGHPEGPQVNDPRAPEWESTVDQHFKWWDQCVQNRIKNGYDIMHFTPEFGPPTYMQTLPYTQQPVADQWAINVHMKDLIRERYKNA